MQAECSICLEDFVGAEDVSRHVCSTLCGHIFHEQCLSKWIACSKTCPDCCSFIDLKKTVRLFLNLNKKKDILTRRSSKILPLQNFKELQTPSDKDRELGTAIEVAIDTLTLLRNTISPIRKSEFCAVFSLENSKIIENHIRRQGNTENTKSQTTFIAELKKTEKKVKEALKNIDIFREKMFIVSRSLVEIMDHFDLGKSEDVEGNNKGF